MASNEGDARAIVSVSPPPLSAWLSRSRTTWYYNLSPYSRGRHTYCSTVLYGTST